MTAPRLLVQSLRSVVRYKARSTFMMLGSLVGVAALALAVSLGQAVEAGVMKTVQRVLGDGSIVVLGAGSRMTGSPRAGAGRLTIDDIEAVTRQLPDVAAWDPQAEVSTTVRHGGALATVRVLGESERWQQVWSRGVTRGQSFDLPAVSRSARVALIGETAARELFPGQDPLDAEIRIGAVPFRVIGVLEPFGTDMHGMDRDDEIVVPITTLMHRLTNTDAITAAKVVLRDASGTAEAARTVTSVLRTRHALDRDQPDDFMVLTPAGVRKMVGMIRRILLLYVPLVAGIVLLVGAAVAATLMLASVNGRMSEIGVRRAVGARPEDVRWQFLVETALTVVAGGVGGIVVAFAGVWLVSTQMHMQAMLSWQAVAIGLVASAITGVLAGVVPAQRAAQLDPVQALR